MTVTLSNGATITTLMARPGTTTVPASDDVYVGGVTWLPRLSLMQRAATRELGERPNSSNDDHQ
ncbi:hypothetical protein OK016_00135 [Vibrio chagasii]|nr:hypothetical protein [Vibrio chagasii]